MTADSGTAAPSLRWSQLVGQRVIARSSGQLLGSMRRLLLDPEVPAVTAAQLEGGPSGQSMLDWSALASIGPEGVAVEAADSAREPRTERERQLMAGRFEILGKLLLTELGDSLGAVEDIEIDALSGRLLRLHVPGEAVDIERLLVFGPDMLVIPEREERGEWSLPADDDRDEG